MAKKVQIRIYPDGKIEAETLGIKGQQCCDYIKVLEKLLNAKAVDSQYTPEYYEENRLPVESQLSVEAKE